MQEISRQKAILKNRFAPQIEETVAAMAPTLAEAENRLLEFVEKWESRYPPAARSWSATWARIVPMFNYTPEIRRAIYTTNAIESLNFSLKSSKTALCSRMTKRFRKYYLRRCETLRKNGQVRTIELERGDEPICDTF